MKRINPINYFFVILVMMSCKTYRYTYAPEPPNNPVFKNKGDSKIEVVGVTNKIFPTHNHFSNGVVIQSAYALTDHLGLMFSNGSKQEKDINKKNAFWSDFYFDSAYTSYKRHSTELGIGWFWALDKTKNTIASFYGGYGWGDFSIADRGLNNNIPFKRDLAANSNRFFLQPSITYLHRYLGVSFAFKVSFVGYKNVTTNYLTEELQSFNLDNLDVSKTVMYEPSLNLLLRFPKIDWLTFNYGGGTSFSSCRQAYRWIFFYGGISIDPVRIFKHSK